MSPITLSSFSVYKTLKWWTREMSFIFLTLGSVVRNEKKAKDNEKLLFFWFQNSTDFLDNFSRYHSHNFKRKFSSENSRVCVVSPLRDRCKICKGKHTLFSNFETSDIDRRSEKRDISFMVFHGYGSMMKLFWNFHHFDSYLLGIHTLF